MPAAVIVQLISQVGIPLSIRILERLTAHEPDDVVAAEWLEFLKDLKSYNELRAEKVKAP